MAYRVGILDEAANKYRVADYIERVDGDAVQAEVVRAMSVEEWREIESAMLRHLDDERLRRRRRQLRESQQRSRARKKAAKVAAYA